MLAEVLGLENHSPAFLGRASGEIISGTSSVMVGIDGLIHWGSSLGLPQASIWDRPWERCPC